MTNILFPLTSDFENANALLKSFKKSDCVFYVGLTSENANKIKKSKFVKVFVYKSGSKKEEMINALGKEVESGKIVILRKVISKQELESFIAAKSDVAVCATKKRNFISNFFYKIWAKIMKFAFDFNFYDGDVSVIAFSDRLSQVAKNVPNLSNVSRVNRWKGVSEEKIQTSSSPAKKEYDKAKSTLIFLGWIALFLAVVGGASAYFVLCKATFLTGFAWAAAILISFVTAFLAVNIYVLNLKTGKRRFGEAIKEVK